MLALAGGTAAQFSKRGYDTAMATRIETGILRYCGLEEARLIMLYGMLEGPAECETVVAAGRALGSEF